MSDSVVCNICENRAVLAGETNQQAVFSNVRKYKQESFLMWRCPDCKSIHAKDDVDLEHYYKGYPWVEQKLDFFTGLFFKNRLRFLKRNGLKKEHTVLELGCNKGLFITFLKNNGYNAFGYDPYDEVYSNKEALKKQYDVVIMYDVLEHVDSPRDYLVEITQYLNKEGLLLICTPDAAKLDLSKPDKYLDNLHQPYHRHILSEKALLLVLDKIGYKKKKITHRYFMDTLFPMINYRFSLGYLKRAGNVIDVAFEPPNFGLIFKSPIMIFLAFFGYFFPPQRNMTGIFKYTGEKK